MSYYVYILSNSTNVVIYTGVTNNFKRRIYEHRNDLNQDSFCSKYRVHKLVYYEIIEDVKSAIMREKQIKGWKRAKKNSLVESMNPNWEDLYGFVIGAKRRTDSSSQSSSE